MKAENSSAMIALMTAVGRFVYADGKCDIQEARYLIRFMEPFVAEDADLAEFRRLLMAVAEDGVVDAGESAAIAAAIARLRAKYAASDGIYDARQLGLPKLGVLVSFCPKFSAFIATIPAATIGGVSFVLYGMISAVGVRNLVESQVDLGKSRNMLIAAVILVLTLGISFSSAGAVKFACGGVNFALSGLAVGAVIGIVLNAILPGKDFAFSETAPTIKDADRFGGVKQ